MLYELAKTWHDKYDGSNDGCIYATCARELESVLAQRASALEALIKQLYAQYHDSGGPSNPAAVARFEISKTLESIVARYE